MSFGIGTACLAVAACLLMPTFYVTPQVGYAFVLIAFTTVVLGGMGSFDGALVGGLVLGVVEALGGLVARRKPRPDRHLPDLHPDPAVPADRPVREPPRMKALARHRCSSRRRRGAAGAAARPAVRGVAQLLDHDAAVRVARPVVEHARRLWRPVLVRPCACSSAPAPMRPRCCRSSSACPALVAAAAGIGCGALVGAFIGALSFRYGLRGSYFALVTLAFAEVFRILASSLGDHRPGLRHPDPAGCARGEPAVRRPHGLLLPRARRWSRIGAARSAWRWSARASARG